MKQLTHKVTDAKATLARPLETVLAECFRENGDKLELVKGAKFQSPMEAAEVVANRWQSGDRAHTQAGFALYSIRVFDASLDAAVRAQLKQLLSDGQLRKLCNVADSVVPRIVANSDSVLAKLPVSTAENVVAALTFDKERKLVPLAEQKPAGRAILHAAKELEKKGERLTQKKAAEIRARYPVKDGGTKKAEATPAQTPAVETAEQIEARRYRVALESATTLARYVRENKLEGADRTQIVNVVVDVARALGMQLSENGKPVTQKPLATQQAPAPAAAPAASEAPKAPAPAAK